MQNDLINQVNNKTEYRDQLPYLVKASYQSQKKAAESLGDRYTADPQLSSMQTKVFVKQKSPLFYIVEQVI